MPDSGKDLGADLYELWRAGRDNLPSVASQYSAAGGYVASTDSELAHAFLRPEWFGGGAYGPVYGPWKGLRDELEAILRDTAMSLELTGEALCLAASQFASVDDAASAEFDRLRQVNGEPHVRRFQ
jgi:hypothetical protein